MEGPETSRDVVGEGGGTVQGAGVEPDPPRTQRPGPPHRFRCSDNGKATNEQVHAPNKKIGEKAMLKVKLIAIIGILSFVGIVFHNSHSFTSSAKGEVFEEIAKYKTWTRINKKPVVVSGEFQIDGASGSE